MATTTSAFALASQTADAGGDALPGSVNSGSGSASAGTIEGASGSSSASGISKEAMIAIIVVVCVVAILGIASAVLFYLAKKREWKVRERIRRSARKVVAVLTPRRSEFPRHLKDGDSDGGSSRGDRRAKLDEVPPTPRIRPDQLDLEKGGPKVDKVDKKRGNFSRK